MLTPLRSRLRPMLHALARPLARIGITPNQVTSFSLPLALVSAYFLYDASLSPTHSISWLYGSAWMLLALLMDALDGALASLSVRQSAFGNYYDALMDRGVELVLFAGLVLAFPLAVFLAFSFSQLVSYAKARVGLVIVADNRDWPSLGERGERLLLLFLGTLATFFIPLSFGKPPIEWALYLIAASCLFGSVQRILHARHLILEAEHTGTLLPYLKK